MYHSSGFTYLEYAVMKEILRLEGKNAKLKIGMVPMKTPSYLKDNFLTQSTTFMPFIVVLCYIAPIFRIISMVVREKEHKTREGMKMMGLKDSAYWSSFFVYYLVICSLISIILTSITMGFLFTYSNWFLMFLFYLLYGLSIFSFGLFLASFFHRSRVASITGTMLYFAAYTLAQLVTDATSSETNKNAASLLPPIAVTLGSATIVRYEESQSGLNFSNAGELIDNYKFSTCMAMMTIDFVMYLLLSLYLENVLPSPTGTRQPLWFFLTRQFWTGRHTVREARPGAVEEESPLQKKNFEAVPPS